MSQPTNGIKFTKTTPSANPGYQTATPQSDGATPQQSMTFETPNTGGAVVKTANYTATIADLGVLLVFNSSSAVTLTLPSSIPLNDLPTPTTETRWNISVQNIGAGTLTVNRNGLNIDGAATNLTLATGSGVKIATDGTNYFTERGVSSAAGITALTGDVTGSGSGSVAATLAASGVTAGTYTKLTVDAKGRATAGASLVASDLPATAVTPGSYTNADLTVDAEGRITAASNGSSSGIYFGQATVAASNGQNIVTLGSTPLPGSVEVCLNGNALPIALMSVSGAVATYSGAWNAGDLISATWATTNSTPGGISLSSSGGVVIRGFAEAINGSGIGISISLPPSCLAGDFAVLIVGASDGTLTTPSGWTANDTEYGSFWGGAVFSKLLTSGDIATGVIYTDATPDCSYASVVVYAGATGGIREIHSNRNGSTTLTSSSAVLGADAAIYFGSCKGTGTDSFSRGTQRGSGLSTSAPSSGCTFTEQLSSSGSYSTTVTYSSGSTTNYQAMVIVEASALAGGTTPEIAQSQVVGLPALAAALAALAPAPTSLTVVGTSGPATLVGNVLNIPTPSGGGGGGGATNPGPESSIPGCFIWFDAGQLSGFSDGNPVNSLTNFAGGPALSVAGTAPVYKVSILNSLPIVRFGGSGWYDTLATDLTSAREVSIFMVMKISSLANGYTGMVSSSAGNFGFYIKSSGKTAFYCAGTNYDGAGAATMSSSNFYVLSFILGPIGINTRVALATDYTSSSTSFQSTAAIAFSGIGNDLQTGGRTFTGDIAEIVAYRRGLSTSEVSVVESYLKAKYGL